MHPALGHLSGTSSREADLSGLPPSGEVRGADEYFEVRGRWPDGHWPVRKCRGCGAGVIVKPGLRKARAQLIDEETWAEMRRQFDAAIAGHEAGVHGGGSPLDARRAVPDAPAVGSQAMPFFRRSKGPKPQAKLRAQRAQLRQNAESLLRRSGDLEVLRSIHAGYRFVDLLLEGWDATFGGEDSFLDERLRRWHAALDDPAVITTALRIAIYQVAGITADISEMVRVLGVNSGAEQRLLADHSEEAVANDFRWTRAAIEALLASADVEIPAEGYTNIPFSVYWRELMHGALMAAHDYRNTLAEQFGEERAATLMQSIID